MKKKDLYLESGYLSFENIYNSQYNFIFVIGGRGIGKTYGALEWLYENELLYIFMRRTQTQADVICTIDMNPYKRINFNRGLNIYPAKTGKYTFGFFEGYVEEGKIVVDKEAQIATGAALSTFANIRGFDATDKDVLIYDEFIPQISERAMKGEGDAFFNMIETINRNRELEGFKPIKVICFSNSTDVANPIFIELGIVSTLMRLKKKGEFIFEDKERSLAVIMPKDSPISEQKKDTALYRLTKGTSFYDSAIDNDFVYNSFTSVKSRPLNEYKPLVNVGEISIYRHKTNNRLYVSKHKSGNVPVYKASYKELLIFRHRFPNVLGYAMMGKIDYEDYACEVLLDKYTEMV